MPKKTALITGITGQDGSYLAEFLLDQGYQVYRHGSPQQYDKFLIESRISNIQTDWNWPKVICWIRCHLSVFFMIINLMRCITWQPNPLCQPRGANRY